MEREVNEMNQMEVKGTIAGDGSIILPPGVLETMGQGLGIRCIWSMTVRSLSVRRTAMGECFSLRKASGRPNVWNHRRRRR